MQIGQIIRGKRVNYRQPRVAAILTLGLSIALAGTTIIVNDQHTAPKPLYGPKLPTQPVGSTGGAGGGKIRIGN